MKKFPESQNEIAQLVRNVRIGLGVSKEEFAKELGLSKSTISLYEKGSRTPKSHLLFWLLKRSSNVVVTKRICPSCNGSGVLAEVS